MGKLVIYTGPMKSGKTKRLIIQYQLVKESTNSLVMLKPQIDNRFSTDQVMSRKGFSVFAKNIQTINDIEKYNEYKNIFIDEFQLLNGDIQILLNTLKNSNIFIAGLNLTSEFKPFGQMNNIMCYADEINVLKGKCDVCNKDDGKYTICTKPKKDTIQLGDNIYKCICENCLLSKNGRV